MNPVNRQLSSQSCNTGNSGEAARRKKMFKRIWSAIFDEDTSDEDTADGGSGQNKARRKRQKREHSPSELSSLSNLTHSDRYQQRDSRRSYPRSHRSRKKGRVNHSGRRENRNRASYQYRKRPQYSYSDCEAESEDCLPSSTDEEDFQHVRNTSLKSGQKTCPSANSDRDAPNLMVNWKRQNAGFCSGQKGGRKWQQTDDDSVLVLGSESESESDSESSPIARAPNSVKIQQQITPFSPEAIGRKIQVKESVRLEKHWARFGIVTAWKDKRTVMVRSFATSHNNSMKLTEIDFLEVMDEESAFESKPESPPAANRANTKVQKAQKVIAAASPEVVGRTVQTKQTGSMSIEKQHQQAVPKPMPVLVSKEVRKSAPERRQELFQKQQSLSSASSLSPYRSAIISSSSKNLMGAERERGCKVYCLEVSDELARKPRPELEPKPKKQQQSLACSLNPYSTKTSSIERAKTERDRGSNVFSLEVSDQAEIEKWRARSRVGLAAKPSDEIMSDSSDDESWILKLPATTVSPMIGSLHSGQFRNDACKSPVAKGLFYDSDSDLDDIQVLDYSRCIPSGTDIFAVGQRVCVSKNYSRHIYLRRKTGTVVRRVGTKEPAIFEVQLDYNGKCIRFRYSSLEAIDGSTPKRVLDCSGYMPPSMSASPAKSPMVGKCASDTFTVGQRIRVSESYGKSYKRGKTGMIIRRVARNGPAVFEVQLDNGRHYRFLYSSLEAMDGSTPKRLGKLTPPGSKAKKSSTTRKTAGKMQLKLSKNRIGTPPAPSAEAQEWIVPQSIVPKDRFMGLENAKIILPGDTKDDNYFLKHILGTQRLTLEVPLKKDISVDKAIKKELKNDVGNTIYKMVSAKIFEEQSNFGGRMWTGKNRFARVVYAADGETADGKKFSIEDNLLRIGDFTTLNPRKIAARLELFQSPTGLRITEHQESVFQEIDDLGYVGGGFIHEDKLFELLTASGMGLAPASRASAIQVRIFIPSMGIFKGVLMKKRTKNGAPIELPSSMKKVMASTHPAKFKRAHILINKSKVHPSKGNEMIGKKLDPLVDDPPEISFKSYIKKPLTKIVLRLWETLGVSTELCERYRIESLEPDRRNHAWLVGVPDPTGSLPPDTIFVPGIKKRDPYDIFVTRLPCYAREHGRKFRAITQKPTGMSAEDWNWLNNDVSFGVIIFSNPRRGMMSIPERIASGDLDGDLYLVCWDKEVVDSMTRVMPLVDQPAVDDGKLSTVDSDPEWFSKTQELHIEKLRVEYGHLIGSLYKLAEKIADAEDEKLEHPDVRALYNAYNEALEYTKHGRPIRLPRHLIGKLKKNLHPFVQPID